ncbi:MAG: hypothetical protein ACLTDR_10845 [Adlercreutzia equolifaciens]
MIQQVEERARRLLDIEDVDALLIGEHAHLERGHARLAEEHSGCIGEPTVCREEPHAL